MDKGSASNLRLDMLQSTLSSIMTLLSHLLLDSMMLVLMQSCTNVNIFTSVDKFRLATDMFIT